MDEILIILLEASIPSKAKSFFIIRKKLRLELKDLRKFLIGQ